MLVTQAEIDVYSRLTLAQLIEAATVFTRAKNHRLLDSYEQAHYSAMLNELDNRRFKGSR
jgi:hypothetical protein